MGTSTVTKKAKETPGKVEYRLAKDAKTSTPELGFCICGLKTPSEHLFKIHTTITLAEVGPTLKKVIYGKGVVQITVWLEMFLNWLEN